LGLVAGTKLGAYEIVALLGAGGMGEVYRARDTRLGREVAIKVIPATFSADMDRLQRFEQEARAAAALNHPNILAVHDVGTHAGAPFIVSELLEGETLRERLAHGPMPVRKAIDLGIQIAQALAAAHDKGIVHRDLKPENIFVNKDGRAKILDFGLAKLTQPDRAASIGQDPAYVSGLPTTPVQTQHGLVLGTLGYMAPEQVRGLTADHRADIFAFGAVLYEMLSGRRAFHGETTADTMSAILKEDPPDLPVAERHIPPALSRIIDRCLEKNPSARFGTAGDLAFALEALSSHSGTVMDGAVSAAVPRTSSRAWVPWALVAAALVAVIALATRGWWASAPAAATFRASLMLPDGVFMQDNSPARLFAVSPDGRRIAFTAVGPDRRRVLWVRSLNALTAQPLAGTEDAFAPFWSPDSRNIGFFAGVNNGLLKRVGIDGAPPTTLCRFAGSSAGADWSTSGDILFTTTGATGGSILRVSESGGASSVVLKPDDKGGETDYWWPSFLPDGKRFLFLALSAGRSPLGIYVGSTDSAERTLVLKGGSNAKYAAGRLLFLRATTLMAQEFDVDRLELKGEAVPIAEQVQSFPPTGAFSVSQTGLLAYASGPSTGGSRLTWLDKGGRPTGTIGEPGTYGELQLSPDGKRAAVTLLDAGRGTRDIWLLDIARDVLTKFTFDPADEFSPVWSPDGSRIAFASRRAGQFDLYEKPSSGAGSETVLLADSTAKFPHSWSPDGQFLLYGVNPGGGADLWVLPFSGDNKPFAFLATPAGETQSAFSPDGRWVAYTSNETSRQEIFVTTFPGKGGKWQISDGGGVAARWGPNGRDIFFFRLGSVMSRPVTAIGAHVEVGALRQVFNVRPTGGRGFYDVMPDGRFLVNVVSDVGISPITLVVNWPAELEANRKK
jgi:Tol biopolymer transport system component